MRAWGHRNSKEQLRLTGAAERQAAMHHTAAIRY
jgi:hypothetical protein